MGEYNAENYVWFIENGRMDKMSNHGMELIAKRFRELEEEVKALKPVKNEDVEQGCPFDEDLYNRKDNKRKKNSGFNFKFWE